MPAPTTVMSKLELNDASIPLAVPTCNTVSEEISGCHAAVVHKLKEFWKCQDEDP